MTKKIPYLEVKKQLPFLIPEQYNDAMSYQELLYAVIDIVNQMSENVNDIGETVKKDVAAAIQGLIDDGTLSDIINKQLFAEIDAKINLINSNTNAIITDLLTDGLIVGNNIKTKRVGDGYDSIKSILDSVEDGDTTVIILPAGTYNMSALFPPNEYPYGCIFPDKTYLIGEGGNYAAKLTSSFVAMNNEYSAINCKGNFGMYNVSVEAYNNRYAIHDDYAYTGKCTRFFKHIALSNFNCYYHAIGGAVGNQHNVIYDNCFIRCNGANAQSAFYYHNRDKQPGVGKIDLINCRFLTTSTDNTTFADIGFDGAFENSNDIVVSIHGCSAHSVFTSNNDKARIELLMDTDIPILGGYFYDRCTAPRLERLGTVQGATYAKGKIVAIVNDAKINIVSTPYAYYGVIAYLDNVSAVVVRAGSVTSLNEINVSSKPSGGWSYLYLQSDLTLGLTKSGYVMGIAYPDSTARLFDYCFPTPS